MAVELNLMKKMSFGDIFEWSFKLFQKHILFIIKSMSYFFIPGIIILIISGIFVYPYIINTFENLFSFIQNEPTNNQFAFDFFINFLKLYLIIIAIFIIYSLFIMASSAASIKALSVKLEGKNESELDIAKFVLKKYLSILGTTVIAGIMSTIGFCFCYIPGLILMVYMIFIPQIILLENKSFFKAIGRSFSLVNKNFWIIVLILIVFYFLYYIASSIISIPFYMVPYIKFIVKIIKSGGEADPSFLANSITNFMKEFFIFIIIIIGIQIITSILYILVVNNSLTLKFYNIRNLKEGTQLLNQLDKEIKQNDVKVK